MTDITLSDEQLSSLAAKLAALLPGYLLLRDPPSVPVGAPEMSAGDVAETAGMVIVAPD